MAKELIKQIIITLLTCIAIVLLLMIVLYQYVPNNKVMPSKVEKYSVPDNIKAEMEKTEGEELANTEEVYEITDAELDKQIKRKSYSPGKSDPFEDYSTVQENKIESKETSKGVETNSTNEASQAGESSNYISTK